MNRKVIIALVIVGFLIDFPASKAMAAPSCHTYGVAPFFEPDNGCTPGSFVSLTRAEVCTPKDRPTLLVATRRRILANYGYVTWTGANGELDHRVPFFLGGRTEAANVWPEPGAIPNIKDHLENYARNRICLWHTMRVRTAVLMFLGNWVPYWQQYIGASS